MPSLNLGMQPVQNNERIVSLDILRALALFGVLWMNFSTFSGAAALGSLGQHVGHGWVDAWVSGLGGVLARNKAMSCFAMLFGIGLFIQFDRAKARGLRPSTFAFRRLGGLFLIGFLHWVLIWNGDVLTTYALVGFLLLLLLDARPRTFLLLALSVVVLGDAVPFLVKALHLPPGLDIFNTLAGSNRAEDAVFGHGSWMASVGLRLLQWSSLETVGFFLASLSFAAPMFLVGALLWKQGIPQDPSSHAPAIRRLFHGTFWVGLLGSFLARDPFKFFPEAWKKAMQGTLWLYVGDAGTYLLALGYFTGLLLLLTRRAWLERLKALAPMGRMALTNYLSQSLVFTWVFYHHGLGLWGRVRPGAALVVVVLFYAAQVAWSHWWLGRFRFGPAEWLWRSMTYGKWQPFRIAAESLEASPDPAVAT